MIGLLVALAAPASAAGEARWFGFNDNTTTYKALTPLEDVRLLERLGANSNRLTVEWRYAQGAEGGRIGFGLYRAAYDAHVRRGIRPLITLLGSPPWARMPFAFCAVTRPCHFPPDRAKDEAWRRYVTAVVRAFPHAAGIEVWNEPNLRGFWESGPDPERYAELLRIAREAIKSVDPDMPVIGPGLAPVVYDLDDPRRMGIRPFLQRMYAAGGAGLHDGLSIHPYVQDRPHGLAYWAIGTTIETRDAAGDRAPLWFTETGYHVAAAGDERRHAVVLGDLLARLRRRPGVEAVYLHELLERRQEPGFGVLRADRTPRPAFCAVQPGCDGPRPGPRLLAHLDAQERVMQRIEAVLARWRGGAEREDTRVCEGELCVTMRFGRDWEFPW